MDRRDLVYRSFQCDHSLPSTSLWKPASQFLVLHYPGLRPFPRVTAAFLVSFCHLSSFQFNRKTGNICKNIDFSPFSTKLFVQILLNHHLLSLVMGYYANVSECSILSFVFNKFNYFHYQFYFLNIYIWAKSDGKNNNTSKPKQSNGWLKFHFCFPLQ